jgi:hypothetical protein
MARDVSAKIANLEEKLEALKAQEAEALRVKLKAARKVVSDLKAKIARRTGKASPTGRRRRMSKEERLSLITRELSKNPNGLSRMKISKDTGIPYPTLVVFLKENQNKFKIADKGKSERYFLK